VSIDSSPAFPVAVTATTARRRLRSRLQRPFAPETKHQPRPTTTAYRGAFVRAQRNRQNGRHGQAARARSSRLAVNPGPELMVSVLACTVMRLRRLRRRGLPAFLRVTSRRVAVTAHRRRFGLLCRLGLLRRRRLGVRVRLAVRARSPARRLFQRVVAFGELAENGAATLVRGSAVIVVGELADDSWTARTAAARSAPRLRPATLASSWLEEDSQNAGGLAGQRRPVGGSPRKAAAGQWARLRRDCVLLAPA
jgi:Single-strand binding protein family